MSEVTAGIKAGRYHQVGGAGLLCSRAGLSATWRLLCTEERRRTATAGGQLPLAHLSLSLLPILPRPAPPLPLPPCPQGTLRCSRFSAFTGWLSSESAGTDILISGRVDMNRAMDGDVVAGAGSPPPIWIFCG